MTSPSNWFDPNTRERLAIAEVIGLQLQPAELAVAPNVQVGAYTLVDADTGGTVEINSATGVIVTVPAGIFAAGETVNIVQTGPGLVTLAAGSGLTLNSPSTLASTGQWATIQVRFRTASTAVLSGRVA